MGRGRIFLAIALTLALHAGLAFLLWPHVASQRVANRIVFVEAILVSQTSHVVAKPAQSEVIADARRSSSSLPASFTSPPSVKPVAAVPEAQAPTSAASIAYLPFNAVDQPASPVGDWLIDPDELPRYSEVRLVLRLWISATGALDRWEVANQSITAELADRILANLDKTPIRPALLNNVAVPSVRQLEVVLTRQ